MADGDSSSPATGDLNSQKPEPTTSIPIPNPSPTPPPPPQQHPPQVAALVQSVPPGPPYAPPSQIPVPTNLPPPPPFHPGMQFNPVANFQNPSSGVPPPGVNSMGVPGSMPQYQGQPPNQAGMRPFQPMANGYPGIHGVAPPGPMPPQGLLRYPSPYPTMVRPGFIMRPPGTIAVQLAPRPAVPGMLGLRPIMMPPMVRPPSLPYVTPAEKPQTTIYIGKIATIENEFMMSILEFCGHVKSCLRAEDPTTKKPKGFGFYEFESAEGILRAIRLLTQRTIDGQELLVNVNQATKEYLLKYVEKKIETANKAKESQTVGTEENQAEGSESEREKLESAENETGKDGEPKKENIDIANSAVLTDDEREADREAMEKIESAIEERLKSNPLPPPPPPPPADGSGMELAFKSKDGDSNTDITRSDAAANDVEASGEHNRPDTSSPDWNKRNDRRSRERSEKEQEMDRYEREAERERARKEREQRRKLEDAERAYQARLRQWERQEREKEKERQYEKEKEKDKERKRKKEIRYEEEEDEEDDESRRRWHRGSLDERRRRRQREKEDDLADRLKEEEEVAEAKRSAEEQKLQQQQLDALRLLSGQAAIGSETVQTSPIENDHNPTLQTVSESVHEHHAADCEQNGSGNESMAIDSNSGSEAHAPSKRLGFGLVGSGKWTSVPCVFYEEDEDEAHKDKKMKPLVPIDYSTEEQEAVAHGGSGNTPPHLALAAEFAKRISSTNPKEETTETEKQRSRRSHDKASHRDRDRDRERDRDRDRVRDRGDGHSGPTKDAKEPGKTKIPDTKFLDAKQLIDTIPKTKEDLFSYEINWAMYDKHQLHERMRPWISKKIMEFLGEEEATLVDFIVSNTQQHVKASQMLELLQSILDEEAEMFVLKMWRMLIFEIKRVEAGVPVKSKA
ncbi:PREDICTED: RNA-binding protein 25-like [Camelina sativa]|uniref:RNA-binding protein 25-like n=1 Tax=Camelina sativa TaxID=90675 RepID=A0ABM0SYH1_CAMSA|nr:PREDICTED: RNA-binding protein 25-like [Camelina sativa]